MDLDANEDPFGDDDFDDLPAATLQTLEQQARLSTQQPRRSTPRKLNGAPRSRPAIGDGNNDRTSTTKNLPSSDYGFDAEEDVIDLDAQPSFVQKVGIAQARPVDEVTKREDWRQQRYGRPQAFPANASTSNGPTSNGQKAATLREMGAMDSHAVPPSKLQADEDVTMGGSDEIDVSALQLRIQELEKQAQTLQKAAEDAKSIAYSKTGEITIVRANQQKELKEFERKMKVLQQQHAEDAVKAKADLDAARKEREKFETNNRFLEHDLARETERARVHRRTLKDGDANASRIKPNGFSTPRKNRSMPLRDGFDDTEVAVLSPSKFKDKARAPSTPKADRKRKRSAHDESANASPGLSFAAPEGMVREDSSGAATPRSHHGPTPALHSQPKGDERFEFMQQIINYRTSDGKDRTLEALTRFHLPSKLSISVASLIYDKLTVSALQQDLEQFRQQICDAVISQWKACLDEQYYDPLYNLTELLQYILVVGPPTLSASLVARITPLCQSTIDIIAVATARALIHPTTHQLPTRTLRSKIDPMHYLDILHFLISHATLVDSIASTSATTSQNFWSHIEFDFILTLLHRAQPLPHVTSMLSLLHHSILAATFGSIYPDATRQKRMEADLVDRLTKLLYEDLQHARPLPRVAYHTDFLRRKKIEEEELERGALPVPEPYTALQLLTLRSDVLDLLYDLVLSDHGGQLTATHSLVIGRLVRFLHESIVKMYSTYSGSSSVQEDMSQTEDETNVPVALDLSDATEDACIIHARNINTVVPILYHLNTTYGSLDASSQVSPMRTSDDLSPVLNIHAYLESQPGASQAYLVALSRVAFCEAWGLDVGIDAETAEMAHEMLVGAAAQLSLPFRGDQEWAANTVF